jgi:hypothetical protein
MSGPPLENRIAPLEAALALPALAWLAAATVVLAAVLLGYRALAAPADLTITEAAVLSDEAELLRQIRHGANPNADASMRRGMLGDQDYIMTPLEAAIAGRHAEVVQLLVDNGATLASNNFPRLLCLARLSDAADIVAVLETHAPPRSAAVDCTGIRLPW